MPEISRLAGRPGSREFAVEDLVSPGLDEPMMDRFSADPDPTVRNALNAWLTRDRYHHGMMGKSCSTWFAADLGVDHEVFTTPNLN